MADPALPPATPPKPLSTRTLSTTIATALFIENMDGTVLATALPTIADAMGENPLSLKLAMTSYMIALAAFIPLSGWMADRWSSRRVFSSAIAVFLLGSVACAFATSLEGFVLARALQGAGGAMMVPVGRLIIARETPKAQLVTAMMWLTMPALVGPVVGPLVGGFIVTHLDWRWIFLLNIPIGLIGIALGLKLIPDDGTRSTRPLDLAGFVLSGVTLVSFMIASMAAERLGFHAPVVPLLFLVAIIAGWLTWRHAKTHAAPLLDLSLLSLPIFRRVLIGGGLFRIGVGAIPFLLPLMLQIGFGLSPVQSGALTFIAAVGAIATKPLNRPLLKRFGFRSVLQVNALISALFLVAISLFSPATPHWLIYIVLFFGGCFRSVQFTSLNALTFAEFEPARMGAATTLSAVAQQVALSLGITVAAGALDVAMMFHGRSDIAVGDFAFAFAAVAVVSASSLLFFLRLPADAGAEMAGR